MASVLFVALAMGAIGVLSLVFRSPGGLSLYRVATLAAVVVLNAPSGLAMAAVGSLITYFVLSDLSVDAPLQQSLHLGLDSGLIVLATWSLSRNLVLSTQWAQHSYEIARLHLREARHRRAEVIRLNQQLERAHERLEHANAALLRALRAAEDAERRQQMMSAFISHELRTPLNLIVGFSEMLVLSPETYESAALPPTVRRDLNTIYRSSTQVAALIDDVLDLASSGQGHLALMRAPANLWEVIEEAASIVRDLIESRGLRLDLVGDRGIPLLTIDRLRIRQVLLNLLINAARFTDHGSITVRVDRCDAHVRVAVSDTGSGISPEKMDALFLEYAAASPVDAHHDRSTGLGLPMSRRLVELHGGEIGAQSRVGAGSTFWWTLPIEGDMAPRSGLTRLEGSRGRGHRASAVVLVLDDDDGVAARLGRWLEGYRFVPVRGAKDLTRQVQEWQPLAIVASNDEPVPEGVNTPLVRCPLPSSTGWAKRLRVADYVSKPVLRSELVRRVRRAAPTARRVLVVDDDARFVEYVTRVLCAESSDWEVTAAYNGREALERMVTARPDLVLLDLALPVLSGEGVLQEMREAPDLADLPVVVVSAPPPETLTLPLGHRLTLCDARGWQLGAVVDLLSCVLGKLQSRP